MARSPTAPAIGLTLLIRTGAVQIGLVAEIAVPFGTSVTVAIVPSSGFRIVLIPPTP